MMMDYHIIKMYLNQIPTECTYFLPYLYCTLRIEYLPAVVSNCKNNQIFDNVL